MPLQEPNHHKTYSFLLETLGNRDLSKMVLKTTYYYCRWGQQLHVSACSSSRVIPMADMG